MLELTQVNMQSSNPRINSDTAGSFATSQFRYSQQYEPEGSSEKDSKVSVANVKELFNFG